MMSSETNEPEFSIAVVDDMDASAQLIKIILESNLNCRVSTYPDADVLLRSTPESVLPDLLMLDVILQETNGIEVFYRLKEMPHFQDVPVFFFSAHTNPRTRVDAIKAGGVDYLDKPFFPEELVVRIRRVLSLYKANLVIRKQIEEQQKLLRVLCHDLKNPVGGAYGLLELILEDPVSHPDEIQAACRSCRGALDLIDHIARQNSLGQSRRRDSPSPINVSECLEECVAIMRPNASLKRISIHLQVAEQMYLDVDRVSFRHSVINNLLHNSIKFSHTCSEIRVEAQTETREGIEGVRIRVIDKGVGIPSDRLRTLISGSNVTSETGTALERGTGMGLSLVRHYTAKFNGTVSIESRSERCCPGSSGTEVSLFFPLAKVKVGGSSPVGDS